MTIPKSYEALAADLASEKIISKTLLGQKEAYMMLADKGRLDLSESKAREDALREELAALRESYEAMRDRKNSIVYLQQRLTVAEQRASDLEDREKKLWATKTWPEEWRSNKDFEKFAERIVGHGPHGSDIYIWIDDIPPTYRVRCLQAFEGGHELGRREIKRGGA